MPGWQCIEKKPNEGQSMEIVTGLDKIEYFMKQNEESTTQIEQILESLPENESRPRGTGPQLHRKYQSQGALSPWSIRCFYI